MRKLGGAEHGGKEVGRSRGQEVKSHEVRRLGGEEVSR